MIEFSGCVLKAALESAARPSKDRPEFWCSRVRIASRSATETVVEATNGVQLFRLTMEKEFSGEAFATRDVVSRLRPDDRLQLDGLQLEIESESGDFEIRASLLAVPEPALMVDGKNLRQWPDFDSIIPKGKRSAASMIGLSSKVIGVVSRACKMLSTPDNPLTLRMQAGGATDPVKLTGRCLFGDVVFVVMPTSIVLDEPPPPESVVEEAVEALRASVPEGTAMSISVDGGTPVVVADKRRRRKADDFGDGIEDGKTAAAGGA